ncbi:unnamed protein product [Durusdinium trenchii]|uniref:Uncharacterized protein n=2 Tax=Durusdinium trenchii TaxID=1381693 RepID=A0ABP0PFY1_9DINO
MAGEDLQGSQGVAQAPYLVPAVLTLPEDEPPTPRDAARDTPRLTRRRSSIASSGCNFHDILGQIQVLQERLLQIYETDAQTNQTTDARTKLAPALQKTWTSKKGKHKSSSAASSNQLTVSLAEYPNPSESPLEGRGSLDRQTSVERRLSRSLVQSARQKTTNLEQLLQSSDVSFQIGQMWAMRDEDLQELQKNNAVTSPRLATGDTGGGKKYRCQTERVPGWAIRPEAPIRMIWDCLAMVVLLVEILTAPLQVYDISEGFRGVSDVLHWVTTCYWLLDVPASFFTGVYINDILHTKLADVARAYLKSWFWFDMLMLAPEALVIVNGLLEPGDAEEGSASGILRALRARRLVRVARFVRILRFRKSMTVIKKLSCYRQFRLFFQGWVSSTLMPILMLTLGLMFAVHFLASLWFLAGDVEGGWVVLEGLHEQTIGQQYVRSVEWAVSRLPASSLKFNVELNTAFERWLAIIATGIALIISSLFVSVLTNLMADVARRTRKMTQIMESVRRYCGTCGVSAMHTMKIRRLVEREHCRDSIQDHMQFLLSLPEGLVKELFHEARSITLACHPFFLEIGAADTTMELNLCNHAVRELYLLENDMLFYSNQKGQGIYLMASGAAHYFPGSEFYQPQVATPHERTKNKHGTMSFLGVFGVGSLEGQSTEKSEGRKSTFRADSRHHMEISAEDYCSEQSLWIRGWKHQGRLEASVESRALHLPTNEVFLVLQDHADSLATAVVYARSFVEAMNNLPAGEISDLPLEHECLANFADPTKSANLKKKFLERPDRVQPEPSSSPDT